LAYDDITCEQYIRSLAEDLAGALSPDERERHDRHAAGCADCTAYRSDYEAVIRTARAAGKADEPLPASLASRILALRQRPH
jgi:hypothetical protein